MFLFVSAIYICLLSDSSLSLLLLFIASPVSQIITLHLCYLYFSTLSVFPKFFLSPLPLLILHLSPNIYLFLFDLFPLYVSPSDEKLCDTYLTLSLASHWLPREYD